MVVRDGEGAPQQRGPKDQRLLLVTAKELRSYADPKTLLVTGPIILFVTEPTAVGRDGEGAVQFEEPKILLVTEPRMLIVTGPERLLCVMAKELHSNAAPTMLLATYTVMVFVAGAKGFCP